MTQETQDASEKRRDWTGIAGNVIAAAINSVVVKFFADSYLATDLFKRNPSSQAFDGSRIPAVRDQLETEVLAGKNKFFSRLGATLKADYKLSREIAKEDLGLRETFNRQTTATKVALVAIAAGAVILPLFNAVRKLISPSKPVESTPEAPHAPAAAAVTPDEMQQLRSRQAVAPSHQHAQEQRAESGHAAAAGR